MANCTRLLCGHTCSSDFGSIVGVYIVVFHLYHALSFEERTETEDRDRFANRGHLIYRFEKPPHPGGTGGKISHPWTTMHDGPTSRTCNPFFWPFGTQNVPPSLRQPIRPPPPLHTPPPPPHRSTVACWAPSVWPTCKFKPI